MSHGSGGPVIVYVLDSATLANVEQWMGEGLLPNMAALWQKSKLHRVEGPAFWDEVGTWLTAYSGVPGTQHGYYAARRLKPGTYDLEIVSLEEARCTPCWATIEDPEFRSLILEPIESCLVPGLRGEQLYNLTAHQEAYARAEMVAEPPEFAARVRGIYGAQSSLRFDRFQETAEYYERQLEKNLETLRRKVHLFKELIRGSVRGGDHRLIVVGFNELHDAAHLLWPMQSGARQAPSEVLRNGVRTLYQAVDAAISELQLLLPADATTWMLSLYGIKEQYPTLEIARKFMEMRGYQVAPSDAGRQIRGVLQRVRQAIPEPVRFAISKHLPVDVQQKMLISGFASTVDFGRSRAFVVPVGLFSTHIRVNLAGREPGGMVQPGPEYYALLDEIEADFMRLIDPVTGEGAVSKVLRTADCWIDGASYYLPDLYVHWKPARHFLERLSHPCGEVRQRKPGFFRDSFHSPPGFSAVSGPGIEASGVMPCCSVLDIAPTLMTLLGRTPPAYMDGKSLLP